MINTLSHVLHCDKTLGVLENTREMQKTLTCGLWFLHSLCAPKWLLCFTTLYNCSTRLTNFFITAAVSEPEVNERGSSLISRRLHYRGLQSLFLTKCKELWLCANGRFGMRSGMRKELWLCTNGNILGCAVIWRKELWLCANVWFRMRSEPCAFLSRFSLFAYTLQILARVSKRL